MARYTGPVCRLCRREGTKLFLKGDRCATTKCPVDRRATAPGQHGANAKKGKEYFMQLREKQKARRYYGVLEKQFKTYFEKADVKEGITGENLFTTLELRFDNTVYRIGLASSRKEARQLVRHAHFELNGKKADIPSIILKVGDTITLKEKSCKSPKFVELIETRPAAAMPKWLEYNEDTYTAKVIALPTKEDIDFDFKDNLIVELYSK